MSRVASPGADSIASSTKIPDSPPHKQPTRQRSLKASRSVENMKSQQSSSSSSHHASSHSSKNKLVINALDRAHNNSTISLVSVAASTHNHHAPMPSSIHSHIHNGKSRHPSPEIKISTSSSLPASTSSSLDKLANGEPLARPSSLGQIVDVLVSPPTSAITSKPPRRSAPPVPPKRRKPPAIPAIKPLGGPTMTTIASSKQRMSPLSRYDP